MCATKNSSILLLPITEMNVSPEFRLMAETNGFFTLQDIVDSRIPEFTTLPNSGYRMLKEFLSIMDQNGLMDLVED